MTAAPTPPAAPPLSLHALTSCAQCSMHRLCLPMGLDDADIGRLDRIIGRRRAHAARSRRLETYAR